MDTENCAQHWSNELGLALSGLFSKQDMPFGHAQHFALLDGVSASFSLSIAEDQTIENSDISAWAWSSNLRKHVWLDANKKNVTIATVARPHNLESYSLQEVNSQLERFLEYLSSDRQAPKSTVIDLTLSKLDKYRQLTHLSKSRSNPDLIAIRSLLLHIASNMDRQSSDLEAIANKYSISLDDFENSRSVIEYKSNELLLPTDNNGLSFHAGLAVRHAGGAIFQRATAQLNFLPQLDLFSGAQSAVFGKSNSLKLGGYFTPPGLARSLAEAAIANKLDQTSLCICDPACGSGVFLAEVLRALNRAKYKGKVTLIGRDVSKVAVEISLFVTKCAALDFGIENIEIDIQQQSSLELKIERVYDIVLMNPPFRSWEQSGAEDKNLIKGHLEGVFKGKPDLSLAFANMAYRSLKQDGVLATLLPIGVLTSEYSQPWRDKISSESTVKLIGSLGDHYIFDFAMVNIATLIVHRKLPTTTLHNTLMLWANEDPKASSTALRNIRKNSYLAKNSSDKDGIWRTYSMPQYELRGRTSWAPTASGSEDIIETLRHLNFPRLGDLFKVQQGIRTGTRSAFIINRQELDALPINEQLAFRPIAEKDGIAKFSITTNNYIFYADGLKSPIQNQTDFRARFEKYAERFIDPNVRTLMARPRKKELWQLSEARAWLRKDEPRIVSRMFIGNRQLGFSVDEYGIHSVVQGYGWTPIWKNLAGKVSPEDKVVILYVYAFLFASEFFLNMVKTVSVNIAGGQYDLAPKYINSLPIPDWTWIKSRIGERVSSIESARELCRVFAENHLELERFARQVFSIEFSQ